MCFIKIFNIILFIFYYNFQDFFLVRVFFQVFYQFLFFFCINYIINIFIIIIIINLISFLFYFIIILISIFKLRFFSLPDTGASYLSSSSNFTKFTSLYNDFSSSIFSKFLFSLIEIGFTFKFF